MEFSYQQPTNYDEPSAKFLKANKKKCYKCKKRQGFCIFYTANYGTIKTFAPFLHRKTSKRRALGSSTLAQRRGLNFLKAINLQPEGAS